MSKAAADEVEVVDAAAEDAEGGACAEVAAGAAAAGALRMVEADPPAADARVEAAHLRTLATAADHDPTWDRDLKLDALRRDHRSQVRAAVGPEAETLREVVDQEVATGALAMSSFPGAEIAPRSCRRIAPASLREAEIAPERAIVLAPGTDRRSSRRIGPELHREVETDREQEIDRRSSLAKEIVPKSAVALESVTARGFPIFPPQARGSPALRIDPASAIDPLNSPAREIGPAGIVSTGPAGMTRDDSTTGRTG